MNKIGLLLFDKSGHTVLDAVPDGVDFYAYHPDHGENVGVLCSPKHTSRVIRYGYPFDWLVELLQRKTDDAGLEVVWLPPRRAYKQELAKIIEAGLIGHRTVLRKGSKIL